MAKKLRFILVILFFTIIGMLSVFQSTEVKANQIDALSEATDGLNTTPDNIGLDPNLFTFGDFSDYGTKNMAVMQDENGRTTGSSLKKAIRMTYFKSEKAAIWSNVAGGNYVDIRKKQTLSLWVYFGPKKHKTLGDGFGDGMAFVLQNSPAGVKAFSNKNSVIGGGETLGVWGIDNDGSVKDPAKIASTAIQNSWALEFDTNSNNSVDPGAANSFDVGNSSQQHIAYGYPGYSGTYTAVNPFLSSQTYFKMNHQGFNPVTFNDGQWHHLTLTWNPLTFKITYMFNDKNPDGSKGTNPVVSTSNKVEADSFGGHDSMPDNKLRWGFTSTTGDSYEANLIAFESIPSSVEADIDSDIEDTTQNKTIKTDSTDKSVNSNDNLNINYNLNYDSGKDKWDGIEANLTLPDKITYTNGDSNQVIGKVTYDDGSADELIYASELSGNTVKHTLAKGLFTTTPTNAKITIYGKANNVNSDTAIDSVRSNFRSEVLIQDADTPDFTIKKSKPINLSIDQSNITVKSSEDTNITGKVAYTDGSTVTNADVNVHATLNGTAMDTFPLSQNSTASGQLNLTIPSAKLTQEKNTLTIYVEDKNGNVSTSSTVLITKSGGLNLKVDDYSFGAINQATSSMLVPRSGLWNIIVNDSREDDIKSPWYLSVTTSGLYNGSNPFKGNVIYRNSNGVENIISNEKSAMIASGHKTQSGNQSTNVGQSWNDAEGIMLRTSGFNTQGLYSGKMNWTLSDTI